MARIDWSVLSGPRVSRRTLLSLAAASGAAGYASRLAASAAPISTTHPARRVPAPAGRAGRVWPHPAGGRAADRRELLTSPCTSRR